MSKTYPRVVEILQGEINSGESLRGIVRKTKLNSNTISNYLEGDTEPTQASLEKIAVAYGVSVAWLRGDEDKSSMIGEPASSYKPTPEHGGIVCLPVYALAGAGPPYCLDALEPIRHICVDQELDGPSIRAVQIKGDSMEPTLSNGSYVGIDIHDKEIISGKLYAIYLPHEGIVVKRLWVGPEQIKIESDNQAAPSHNINIDRVDWDTFIQGRVKWWIVQER